jgi:hypothetical protein
MPVFNMSPEQQQAVDRAIYHLMCNTGMNLDDATVALANTSTFASGQARAAFVMHQRERQALQLQHQNQQPPAPVAEAIGAHMNMSYTKM